MYRQLGKAIYGERKLASKLVDLAYGRRGHRRYAMLKDFAAAHPEAAPALRDFVPQDLVKRNRTKVFPPAPAAMQAQAEAVMYAAVSPWGTAERARAYVCARASGRTRDAPQDRRVRTPVATAVRRAAWPSACRDARDRARAAGQLGRLQAHARHARAHPAGRPRWHAGSRRQEQGRGWQGAHEGRARGAGCQESGQGRGRAGQEGGQGRGAGQECGQGRQWASEVRIILCTEM